MRFSFQGVPGAVWIAGNDEPAQAMMPQALAGFAQDLSGWLGREIRSEAAEPRLDAPAGIRWIRVDGSFEERPALEIWAGIDEPLLAALTEAHGETPAPKTFDLLMDVELPVSISFGRAQVPLKDVLKLSTGSIVELNRSIGEPVEVIVNNCVIALGEVVVIEGNFGVRIQQVISRQERLRTLH